VTAMPGRKWRSEPIPLASYMIRRDVARIAREAERERAEERALVAFMGLNPSPAFSMGLMGLALQGGPQMAVIAALYLHMRRSFAFNMAAYLSMTIPRPLFPDTESYNTVPFHLWATPASFAAQFRLSSLEELQRLFVALEIPDVIQAPYQGRTSYTCPGIDGLAVTLARLSFPGRLNDLRHRLRLGWSISKISILLNACTRILQDRWGKLVKFDHSAFQDPLRLQELALAVRNAGHPLLSCCALIDGTTFAIARPRGDDQQRAFYNGHKRQHIVRYQAITTPDGMIVSFFGPHAGKCRLLSLCVLAIHARLQVLRMIAVF
jgi:hypothetical protein